MAYRRGLAAIGAGLSGFGDAFGSALLKRALEEEDRKAREAEQEQLRQMTIDAATRKEDQDSRNRITEKYYESNPLAAAEHLGQRRKLEDVSAPLATDISKADTPEKALTDEDVINRFLTTGGRMTLDSSNIGPGMAMSPNPGGASAAGDLLAQAGSRRGMLEKAEAEKRASTARGQYQRFVVTNPNGTQTETMMLPDDPRALAGVQTKPDAKTQGNITGVAGSEAEAVQRPGAVARAGAMAGAEARARAAVEYDPKNVAARINEFTQRAIVEAGQALSKENASEAMKAADSAKVASIALGQLKPLWDQVKLGSGVIDSARRVGRVVGNATGTLSMANPTAAMLDKQAQAYSMLLYRAYGGTGANVSDKDIQFMQAGLPFSWNVDKVGDKVFSNSALMLTYSPMIKGRYGLKPFEEQMQIVNTWLALNDAAKAAGATEFADPFKPGATVPVK